MKLIIILFAFIGISVVQGETRTNFLQTGQFECEGKVGTNYSYIAHWSGDAACSNGGFASTGIAYLITNQQNGQKLVNVLNVLVESDFPIGAYHQYEALYLASTGNLEGNYLYLRQIALEEAYLKKCSSVLGYSFLLTKSQVLLITEKLDPNIFLKPNGAFEGFIKSATTICQGTSIIA